MNDLLNSGWHEVEIDGVKQAYEVVGEGPLCVVHSGGPGINSDYLRMPLLERHFTLIYLDPVGTGKSGLLPGGAYSVPEYARRVELLLAVLEVTDVYLLGHSHGGFVALQCALDHPERLRGLILYDSAPTYSSGLVNETRRRLTAFAERWPDRPEASEAVRLWRARHAGEVPVTDRASHREYLNGIMPIYFADLRKTTEELGARPTLDITFDPDRRRSEWDVRDRLESVGVPSVVIVGTHDFICPPTWAREMHAKLPKSQLVELTLSGHFAHLEQPDEFMSNILAFTETVG